LKSSQSRSEYVPKSQFKATKVFCIPQNFPFLFQVAIRIFMHRTISYCVGWENFNRIQFYDSLVRCKKCNKLTMENVWLLHSHQKILSSHSETNIPNIRKVFISG